MAYKPTRFFFNRPFPDWLTRLLVPILVGVVMGALAGAFVYPRVVTTFNPPEKELYRGKIEAKLSVQGAPVGAWLGASAGAVFGVARFAMMRLRRLHRLSA